MFNKKNRIKIKTFTGILMCAVAVLAAPCTSLISYASESTDIEARTEIREWRFKIEDGKLYRRLYNRSTGLWETDWIYVGEV